MGRVQSNRFDFFVGVVRSEPKSTENTAKLDPRIIRKFEDIACILGEDPAKLPREFLERRYLGARSIAKRIVDKQGL